MKTKTTKRTLGKALFVWLAAVGLIFLLFSLAGCSESDVSDIPALYLSGDGVGEAEAARGGYTWRTGLTTVAETDAVLNFEGMREENTITVGGETMLTLSNEPGGIVKRYKSVKSYEILLPDQTVYDDGTREATDSLAPRLLTNSAGNAEILTPFEPGEYLFVMSVEYARGWAEYGVKIIVEETRG